METQEDLIAKKALEYGYESCGIIKVGELSGFADLRETYPWARSIVVCIVSFCNYAILEHLDGLVGRNYLVDVRSNEICKEYRASIDFEDYLCSLGMELTTDRNFGVTAMRWEAQSAGLGVVRKNNFFYTDNSGSWVHIEAFLTDREMEFKREPAENPCPENCDRCIAASLHSVKGISDNSISISGYFPQTVYIP